jgi:hypothetical protein
LSDEADQALRQALVIRQTLEGRVEDTHDRPEVSLGWHLRVSQPRALYVEEAYVNLLRGARGMHLNVQPHLLPIAKVSEAGSSDVAPRKRHRLPVDGNVHIK